MTSGDGESWQSTVANLQTRLESEESFESAVEELISLVGNQYSSVSPSDQESIYGAVCGVETQLTTKFNSCKFWATGLKLFETTGAVVSQPEEVKKMQLCIKQAHEAVKEVVGDVDAVTANEQSTAEAETPLVPEMNGKLDEDAPLESSEAASTRELRSGVSEVEREEPVVSVDWNSAPSNGSTSGWASADPPVGLDNGTTSGEPATPESGVLGAVPHEGPKKERKVLSFYLAKIPRPLDNGGKSQITTAEQRLQDKTDARNSHNSNVQSARTKRNEAYERVKAARQVERDCRNLKFEKIDEMRPLQDNLRKLKEAGRSVRQKTRDLPTSEEDLDHRIASLEWTIQHESIPLKEEKQLMREIKQLQASRETVRANAALFTQVHESLGQREEIEEALKPLNAEYKKLELELNAAIQKREAADMEYEQLNKTLDNIVGQLQTANNVRQEAWDFKRSLQEQEYLRTKDFYDNKREITQAKTLASQLNNSKVVDEYCRAQVERFLELWCNNAEFRKTYMKNNERSTVRRLGTLDGRSLGPGEESPVLDPVPSTVPVLRENGPRGGNTTKEAAEAEVGRVLTSKEPKSVGNHTEEEKPASKRESKELEPAVSQSVVDEQVSQEKFDREAAELKEKRRAAEMAKAKEAEERKKRTAERSQSKALAWAQKEAERKVREREKRARKKAASAGPSAELPSSSEWTPLTETDESSTEIQEPVPEATKVSSRQRKRGVTNSQKRAAKAAVANSAALPASASSQKVFGLPLQVLLGIGSVVAIVVAILIFVFFGGKIGNIFSGSGDFKEGARFKARPDVSSNSFSQH